MSEYFEDDIIDVIEQVVNEKVAENSFFIGIVKSISDDATIEVFVPEIQAINEEDDSENWMIATPVFLYNSLPPIKDQQVLIFQRNKDDWRYIGWDYTSTVTTEAGDKKYIPYANDDTETYIIDNDNDDTLTIKKGTDDVEKSLLGETLRDKLIDLITAIRNITVMTPVGPSGTVNDIPSNMAALDNIENNIDEILSNKLRNN